MQRIESVEHFSYFEWLQRKPYWIKRDNDFEINTKTLLSVMCQQLFQKTSRRVPRTESIPIKPRNEPGMVLYK